LQGNYLSPALKLRQGLLYPFFGAGGVLFKFQIIVRSEPHATNPDIGPVSQFPTVKRKEKDKRFLKFVDVRWQKLIPYLKVD